LSFALEAASQRKFAQFFLGIKHDCFEREREREREREKLHMINHGELKVEFSFSTQKKLSYELLGRGREENGRGDL